MTEQTNLDLPPGWRLVASAHLRNRFVAIGPGIQQVVWGRFLDPRPDTIPHAEAFSIIARAWNMYRRDTAEGAK